MIGGPPSLSAGQDVGSDAFFEAVVDRAQVQDGFHVPQAAVDFEGLLVAGGDVLGGEVGVAGAKEEFAVQALLGLDSLLVDAQQAGGADPRNTPEP